MNWNHIKDNLKDSINNVKEQWIWFIDDQIDVIEGKRNHLCGKPEILYMINDEEAEKRLAEWQRLQRERMHD